MIDLVELETRLADLRAIGAISADFHAQSLLEIDRLQNPWPGAEPWWGTVFQARTAHLTEAVTRAERAAAARSQREGRNWHCPACGQYARRPHLCGGTPVSDAPRVEAWSLFEPAYIQQRWEAHRRALCANIARTVQELEHRGPRATKRQTDLFGWLSVWVSQYAAWQPEPASDFAQSTREKYLVLVKAAIRHGQPVPPEVIAQYPEFAKAQTARARYEKGRHTSFANRSAAVNDTMQAEYGIKVKRQDGKPITESQIAEILAGVQEIESVLGSLRDMLLDRDVTIAHTSGKRPFLSKAAGLYTVRERTITMGVMNILGRPIPSLAHELGHFLDDEARLAEGVSDSLVRRGDASLAVTIMRRRWNGDPSEAEEERRLLYNATQRINAWREVKQLLKLNRAGDPPLPEAIKAPAEFARVILTPYFAEPQEVWARLFEQFIGTRLGRGGVSVSTEYPAIPGYWTAADWALMELLVERTIQRRLAILRSHFQRQPQGRGEAGYSRP